MLFRRHFTVMVVPDAQALLRRFHIRGGQIAGGILGLAALIALALSSPLFLLWGIHVTRELSKVRDDRDHLVARAQAVEQNIAELRNRLAAAEKKTQRLNVVAGIEVSSIRPSNEGNIVDAREMTPEIRADRQKAEADDLVGRASLVEQGLGRIEEVLGAQSERLAKTPSFMPTNGLIGAGFGWRRDPFTGLNQFHRGIDICAPMGTPVRAPADGWVLRTERDAGYGNVLTLGHGDGITTRFGHLSAFKVKPGDKVHRGDVIALVGNTGRTTGPHVHYEIFENGASVNPEKFLGHLDLD